MSIRANGDVARKIFLIATEESGDRLGAQLMKVLRQRFGDAIRFTGVGGRAMGREGLKSLFPISQLSIMGFSAVDYLVLAAGSVAICPYRAGTEQ